jgi:hypothetical protein
MNREKIIEEALKRTPIEGLEWILKDDRFGFGANWSENELPECEEEWAGYYIQRAIDVLKEQETSRKNRLPYSPDSNEQWT